MVTSTKEPQKNTVKKPAKRKTRLAPPRATEARWEVKGKIALGSVEARGNSRVTIRQTIQEYIQLSEDEEKRQKEESELDELEQAIRQKLIDWQSLVSAPLPAQGNPYLFMDPFGFNDGPRFFGRAEILEELLNHLSSRNTVFLDGVGKTSLIQAGLIPALLGKGHLPLLVSVSKEALGTSIKKQFLPNIEEMDFLRSMSLTKFLRCVSDLQPGQLFVLVDQFEDFSVYPEAADHDFIGEWRLCFSGNAPKVHWLFCIPAGATYLLNMFKDRLAINPNRVTLQPLEREEAHQAMLGQAGLREIEIDPPVADTILDELTPKGKAVIDPGQLQLVCYMLAGANAPLVKHWTMQYYIDQKRVGGILGSYLSQMIGELDPVQREPAWKLLSVLIDPSQTITTQMELIQEMNRLEVNAETTVAVLRSLEESHLVVYTTAYQLTSASLRPGIQEWRDKRAALAQAKEEVWRQVRTIGGSALRGMIGGALGFTLAYWVLPYVERVPITHELFFQWYVYNLALRALAGALAGFLMILAVDLSLATFKGKRRNWRLPAGMAAGALSLALALAFHVEMGYAGTQDLAAMGRAALEGGVWGVAAGAGVVWILISSHGTWLKIAGASLVCGLVLLAADLSLQGLDVDAPAYAIFLSGVLLPLFLIGSALAGRPTVQKDG